MLLLRGLTRLAINWLASTLSNAYIHAQVKGNMSLAMKFNTVLTATRKQLEKSKKGKKAAPAAAGATAAGGGAGGAPKAQVVFDQIAEALPTKGSELVAKMKGVIQWYVCAWVGVECVCGRVCECGERLPNNKPTATLPDDDAHALRDINGEKWLLDLKNGNGSLARGEGPADLTVTMSDDVFFDVSQGKVSAQQAFMKVSE